MKHSKLLAVLLSFVILQGCGGDTEVSAKENDTMAEKVLVVINENSDDSIEVGSYYAKKRNIPPKNICYIKCWKGEDIYEDAFEKTIRTPVEKHLEEYGLKEKIDYIVLTRGIPTGYRKGTVEDKDKKMPSYCVDSAMVTLYRSGKSVGMKQNPYHASKERFSSTEYGMYLVTRLDGFSLEDAKALVDRSLAAKPQKGLFLFDANSNFSGKSGYSKYNIWMENGARSLETRGYEVRLDKTKEFVYDNKIMGYSGWGGNAEGFKTSIRNKLTFLPGAIAEQADSYSGGTLDKAKRTPKRSYAGDLIELGVTGTKGYANEPYLTAIADPEILFDRYTRGYNLAESFYAASRLINWQDIVFGDPLCCPYKDNFEEKSID